MEAMTKSIEIMEPMHKRALAVGMLYARIRKPHGLFCKYNCNSKLHKEKL